MSDVPFTIPIPHAVYAAMVAQADAEGTCVEDIVVSLLIAKYVPPPAEWN